MVTSCGSSKKAATTASAPAYNSVQAAPSTVQQSQSLNRGVKQQKEECEELALFAEAGTFRDAGNNISDNESLATNLALLDARAKLAQQLEVLVSGMARNFAQQHTEGQNSSASVGKGTNLQQGYFEQFLRNSRPVCKNSYVKEDGRYNVYVCVEMPEAQTKAMVKQLKQDKIIEIDVREDMALQELEKQKAAYKEKLEGQ
ncbi:hypothetical protein AGMMS4956_18610 [Bacteroidia bacterium]|nr:hypothetical protein AGMMS4956_18610 [Bacteroidia bacterium]